MKNYLVVISMLVVGESSSWAGADIDKHLVDIKKVNSKILVEARYSTYWNFMGRPVAGYRANKCFLTKQAATALSRVQDHVETMGYSLLMFDCYRPKRAVADFVNWAKGVKDKKMKDVYYKETSKGLLIQKGYISSRSGHSRGSTIDLTLVKTPARPLSSLGPLYFKEGHKDCRSQNGESYGDQLDMGTIYDCFSVLSATNSELVTLKAKKNRFILRAVMEKFGFENYSREWWHYSLKDESNKKTYFDYIIR